jgi:capsular polysaccharide transport system permease protein
MSLSPPSTGRVGPAQLIAAQWRVLVALMLRDIRTRFFGSAWGFLIVIAWPLSHIVALLAMRVLIGRTVPYGESAALWFATGIIPFMSFSYMSRFIMIGIVLNRPLLNFPVLKITDILFARAIIEILNAGAVIIILLSGFWFFDVDFMPLDVTQAAYAIIASMLLGLGMGVINAIIATAVPMWLTGYALLLIVLWISSGVFFVPSSLPEIARNILYFNPAVHGIEWMRSAYYDGYNSTILSKTYILAAGLASLAMGLLIERLFRGRLLQP